MRAPPLPRLPFVAVALVGVTAVWAGLDGGARVEAGARALNPSESGEARSSGGPPFSSPFGPSGFFAPPAELHEFYFTRAIYSSYGRGLRGLGRGGGSWSTDYPKADRQFLIVIKRILGLDAFDFENAVSLSDPELRRYPFLYALEVGRMDLTEEEVRGLRDYLFAGGFLVIDDFWGTQEWNVFEYNLRRVLPDRPLVELTLDHPLFHSFFEITEIKQVPNRDNGIRGGPTWERDGYIPHVYGMFDDNERLMAVINWNTDLGDAWEWAENPYYPLEYSTFAYEMGANLIVYGMSH